MRKITALICVLVILSNVVFALAEIPNVSSLSNEELHQLQVDIIRELGLRKELPSFTAPIGIYEAGKDFPVGKYLISSPNYCTYITIYENMAAYTSGKALERKVTLYGNTGGTKVVDFREGMVVFVDFNTARFEPFTGLQFD